jgi:CRP-like cAMP-binding protein
MFSLYGSESLFRPGDPVDFVYLVISGHIGIISEDSRITEVGPGELVGETEIVP